MRLITKVFCICKKLDQISCSFGLYCYKPIFLFFFQHLLIVKEEVEPTALDSIDIKMRTDHVTIEMDQSFAEQQRLEHKEQMSLVDDNYRSKRSLKQYYLGCSCSVCYQRYHISKGYHCCDSKSRCNVRRYDEELEDSIDSHSAPVGRKIETMNKVRSCMYFQNYLYH